MSAQIDTTLGALVQAEGALHRLGLERLPIKAAYHLSKLARLVLAETKEFETQRLALVEALGAPNEQGVLQVTPEHMPEFTRLINELAAVEITIPWGPLDLTPLRDLRMSASDVAQLGPLVTFTDESEKSI